MVVPLKPPDVVELDLIDAVVAERKGGRNADFFEEKYAAWRERIEKYISAKGNPEDVRPWPDILPYKKMFLNLYGNPKAGSSHGKVLSKLRERTLQLCPACGEDGTPNTLDHYLPKEDYPEFAITAVNLFPMCDICQGKKLRETTDLHNQRLFLHPYYDDFLGQEVVILKIGGPFQAPTDVLIEPSPVLTLAQSALIRRHLGALEIPARYQHFFRDQYLRLLRLVSDMRSEGQDVRAMLGLFLTMAASKSLNSWPHIFYAAVLSNAALLDYLETAQLPGYI